MDASIIIPIQVRSDTFLVYLEHLDFCLHAANMQNHPSYEIILVDYISASKYALRINKMADKYGAKYVRVDRDDRIWARGRALNCGINVASGNYVLFVDSDCVIPKFYLKDHLNHASSTVFTYSEFYNTDPKIKKSGEHLALMKQKKCIKPPLPNCHSHQCILRSVVDSVGLFDETYRGWGAEDNDIFLRLTRFGMKSHKVKAMPVHLYHPTWQELMNRDGLSAVQKNTLKLNRARYWQYRRTGKKE